MLETQPVPDAVQQSWRLGRDEGHGKIIGHQEYREAKKKMKIQDVSMASEIIGLSDKLLLAELSAIQR